MGVLEGLWGCLADGESVYLVELIELSRVGDGESRSSVKTTSYYYSLADSSTLPATCRLCSYERHI